jgi:hypothetical protein
LEKSNLLKNLILGTLDAVIAIRSYPKMLNAREINVQMLSLKEF